MSVYVCSDLHGQYKLYQQLLAKLNFSQHDELYILGDVIDRGPQSVELLKDIVDRPNVHMLVGNHELMMYAHIHGNRALGDWLNSANGGRKTLSQLRKLPKQLYDKLENYVFNHTSLQVELQLTNHTYLLSHSAFIQNEHTIDTWTDRLDDAEFVTWYSPWRTFEYFGKYRYDDGRIHLIGHVPVQAARQDENMYNNATYKTIDVLEPLQFENLILIDGGCAYVDKDTGLQHIGLLCVNLTKFDETEDLAKSCIVVSA